jgi:hypothetical protein
MDRRELLDALRAAGVAPGRYEIAGYESGPYPVDRYFLEERSGEWVIGVHERGRRDVIERFPDEDRACRRLHDLLTDPGPAPAPLTPAEEDELLHHRDAIQRRAREELERALAARQQNGRNGQGGAVSDGG